MTRIEDYDWGSGSGMRFGILIRDWVGGMRLGIRDEIGYVE